MIDRKHKKVILECSIFSENFISEIDYQDQDPVIYSNFCIEFDYKLELTDQMSKPTNLSFSDGPIPA